MPTVAAEIPTIEEYERLAEEYMASLPLESFMDNRYSGIQRAITLELLSQVSAARPEFQVCNEFLVQYPRPDGSNGQVRPDIMVVMQEQPIQTIGSFNPAHETSGSIFMVLEHVSKGAANQRKDYETNRKRYETELKVPYYVIFDPISKRLTVLHLEDEIYVDVPLNERGRHSIPDHDLDLELSVHRGWLRFWHEGKFLERSSALKRKLAAQVRKTAEEKKRANQERKRADEEKRQKELERQKAEDATKKADEATQRLAFLAAKFRELGIDPDL